MAAGPLRIGIMDLHAARAVRAWAAAGRHPVLLYGLDARQTGAGFWRACTELIEPPLVVDCEAHVGTALAALRVGLKRLYTGDLGPATAAFTDLARAHGAVLVTTPPAIRLDGWRSTAAQLARWRFEGVTNSASADKHRDDRFISCVATGHEPCD